MTRRSWKLLFSLREGRSTRRFHSAADIYERPLAVLAEGRLLTRRESASMPPNLVLRSGAALDQAQALAAHVDPRPACVRCSAGW